MPLLGSGEYREPREIEKSLDTNGYARRATLPGRRQSQHSGIAKSAIMSQVTPNSEGATTPQEENFAKDGAMVEMRPARNSLSAPPNDAKNGHSISGALSDTPATTAPNSPTM